MPGCHGGSSDRALMVGPGCPRGVTTSRSARAVGDEFRLPSLQRRGATPDRFRGSHLPPMLRNWRGLACGIGGSVPGGDVLRSIGGGGGTSSFGRRWGGRVARANGGDRSDGHVGQPGGDSSWLGEPTDCHDSTADSANPNSPSIMMVRTSVGTSIPRLPTNTSARRRTTRRVHCRPGLGPRYGSNA